MKQFLRLILILLPSVFFAQGLTINEILWSSNRHLKPTDYKITVADSDVPIRSSINVSMQMIGYSVFNKNFNQNIINKFSGDASAINPNFPNINQLIKYEQLQFDLSEIQARKMRREMLINKKTLWKGFDYMNNLFSQISTDLNRILIIMNKDTNYGQNEERVNFWRNKVDRELHELSDFDYNNKATIKIKPLKTVEI